MFIEIAGGSGAEAAALEGGRKDAAKVAREVVVGYEEAAAKEEEGLKKAVAAATECAARYVVLHKGQRRLGGRWAESLGTGEAGARTDAALQALQEVVAESFPSLFQDKKKGEKAGEAMLGALRRCGTALQAEEGTAGSDRMAEMPSQQLLRAARARVAARALSRSAIVRVRGVAEEMCKELEMAEKATTEAGPIRKGKNAAEKALVEATRNAKKAQGKLNLARAQYQVLLLEEEHAQAAEVQIQVTAREEEVAAGNAQVQSALRALAAFESEFPEV
ncbi:hypothetical protein T484DRAFT_1907456, partial [Baffinella frigidus]